MRAARASENAEIQTTKFERMKNVTNRCHLAFSVFGLRASFVIRHSCFAICPVVILMLTAQAMAQFPNLMGRWDIDITFGDGNQRSLRFDAQEGGKGTLLVVDPRLKVWGPGKPSEAKWTREDQSSVTFTGSVEFMLGNVGRDAGTLMFKGKFETPDVITGDVDFAPLVGDRPTRHGTFKATRNHG